MIRFPKLSRLKPYEVSVRVVERRSVFVFAQNEAEAIASAREMHEDQRQLDEFEFNLETSDDWQACEVQP